MQEALDTELLDDAIWGHDSVIALESEMLYGDASNATYLLRLSALDAWCDLNMAVATRKHDEVLRYLSEQVCRRTHYLFIQAVEEKAGRMTPGQQARLASVLNSSTEADNASPDEALYFQLEAALQKYAFALDLLDS